MSDVIQISASNWHLFLAALSSEMQVYVPVKINKHIDYKLYKIDTENIVYNHPLPVTPLKSFFLPVKENVVIDRKNHNKKLIIGVPSCDLNGLGLLDEIYLDERFVDGHYRESREQSILIGTDCHDVLENCHCTSYGIDPFPDGKADAAMAGIGDKLIFNIRTAKAEELFSRYRKEFPVETPGSDAMDSMMKKRDEVRSRLEKQNNGLPDYQKTGKLIRASGDEVWIRHSSTCVSCGACAVICPTCTCFLLIDRPDFEKVRQVDACQYPGFERIAAGEDPLKTRYVRFRNRYMCKYVWKPETFSSIACTGCGRCIDSCIGNISKNKLFLELADTSMPANTSKLADTSK